MKIQEVILKAMAGKLKWWEAAEIIEVTDRTMRRWRQQYEEHGYSGLWITASSVRVRSVYRRPIWNGAAAVPRAVFRPERAALSREAARGARDPYSYTWVKTTRSSFRRVSNTHARARAFYTSLGPVNSAATHKNEPK